MCCRGKVAGVVIAKRDKRELYLRRYFKLIRGKLEKAPDVYSFSAAKSLYITQKLN